VRTGVVPRGPVGLTRVRSLARSIDASPEGSVVLCGLTDEQEARCVLVDAEGALVQRLGVRPAARGFVGARDGVCVVTDTSVECVNWEGEWATRAAFPGAASLTVETTFSCGLFDGAPAVCVGVGAARVESLLALQ
jgi:hypothetical protein